MIVQLGNNLVRICIFDENGIEALKRIDDDGVLRNKDEVVDDEEGLF